MGLDATTLFSGTFERSMDAKKRVAVPATWLTKEEGEIFHVLGHPKEGYLIVMPPEELDLQQQIIDNSSLTPQQKRIASRGLYGSAQRVSTDKQGRILLTEEHCRHAGLESEIVFIGGRRRFEIWSKARHDQNAAESTEVLGQIFDSIGL